MTRLRKKSGREGERTSKRKDCEKHRYYEEVLSLSASGQRKQLIEEQRTRRKEAIVTGAPADSSTDKLHILEEVRKEEVEKGRRGPGMPWRCDDLG